jgi:hypothetical protein
MANTKTKKDSIFLYIITILAIIAVIMLAIIMNKSILLKEELTEQGIKIKQLQDVISSFDNETMVKSVKGCWCPGKIADYWSNDCSCIVQEAVLIEEKLQ